MLLYSWRDQQAMAYPVEHDHQVSCLSDVHPIFVDPWKVRDTVAMCLTRSSCQTGR